GDEAGPWRAWWRAGPAQVLAHLDERIADVLRASGSARAAGLLGLAGVRDRRVVRLARCELASPAPELRVAAARALGQLRAWAAVPDLARGLLDEAPAVAAGCQRALLGITGVACPPRPELWLEWWEESGAWER
ncbi:MAG TPA: hypothetical protein VHF22_02435, partial [Planctomycetota bacterium]|nr:hypothetical protein [Planctomycetota bacterium]